MLVFILVMLCCAVAYALKGGSGAEVFTNWNYVREKTKLLDRLLDGKIISTIFMFFVSVVLTQGDAIMSVLLATAWLVSVAPSMGEEHGAVGDHKSAWGPYIDKGFGRGYGIKKAVQRGLVFGAAFTLVTGYTPFLLASLLFVPCIYVGQVLNRLILKKQGWTIAEPIIGAFVIGLPLAMYI